MKILYCIPTLEHGGAERQLSYLATELARAGHEVHVASTRGGANLDRLRAGRVAWHEVGGSGNYDPKILYRLVALIRKLRPDMVQTSLAQMDILGGTAALLTHTPWVLRESSAAPSHPPGWKSRLRVSLARRATAVVSNSEGGNAYWRSAGLSLLHVIPNGIPFDEIEKARPEGVEGVRLDPGRKLLLFAGRMDEGKNVESLINALAEIAGEVPFVAVLCGDGPCRPDLERLAVELGLSDRLLFPGYVQNLWSLMKSADAFISLSRFEGCPNVVMEAMASGCPLVVSDISAHRAILDECSALFAHPEKPSEAARALKTILLSGDAAQERARAARARSALWTVGAMAEQYERLYMGLRAGA